MSGESYDVTVVGAGPAGATAAIMLAQRQYRVALIDRSPFPRQKSLGGWLNARATELLGELKVSPKPFLSKMIAGVTFHNADFSKRARPAFEEPLGYLIDRIEFGDALVEAARNEGVTVVDACAVRDIQLRESSTIAELRGERQIESRLMFLATGRGSALVERAGFPRVTPEAMMWTAQVDSPATKELKDVEPQVDIVLGLDKNGSFGTLLKCKDRISVIINWARDRQAAIPALAKLCKTAFAKKALPIDLSPDTTSAEAAASPASLALDLDSHVGKHTLIIGDAGGFVSAISNEGIYPAMWSARMAVDVAVKALSSVHSQDALMTFDSAWRLEMADYIRSPNTDNQFLLPLVFSNQPMADRMCSAFFAGDNI